VFCCHNWFGPDIWYHLFLGREVWQARTFMPQDHLLIQARGFVDVYWFFQLVCYGLYRLGGIIAVSSGFALAWVGILVFWAKITEITRFGARGAWIALAAILIFQLRFEPRPEIPSYLFLCLQLFWLTRWDAQEPLSTANWCGFILTEIAWASCHGYFALGPALAALRCVCAGRDRVARKRYGGLSAALAFASLLTPLGWKTWGFFFRLSGVFSGLGSAIQEFKAPVGGYLDLWTVWLFWLGWASIAVLVIQQFRRREPDPFSVAAATLGLALSAQAFRNIPLGVILSAPLLRQALGTPRWKKPSYADFLPGALALGLAVYAVTNGFYESLSSQSGFGIRLSEAAYPISFADYYEKIPSLSSNPEPIFNASGDGGYLEFRMPDRPWTGDSRFTDSEQTLEYFGAAKNTALFERFRAAHALHAALLDVVYNHELLSALLMLPEWKLAYADLHRAFIVDSGFLARHPDVKQQLDLYGNEDLSRKIHGMAAIQWTDLTLHWGSRDLLLLQLKQLSQANHIPSFVLEFALKAAIDKKDRLLFDAARELRPKMLALRLEDEQVVDSLLAQNTF